MTDWADPLAFIAAAYNLVKPPKVAGGFAMTAQPEPRSEVTCPQCGHRRVEEMPTDACRFFYECEGCGAILRPKAGDCCVFCSYGSIPCPSIQHERWAAAGAAAPKAVI